MCELEDFIDRYSYDHLLIAGDFNVDFSRNTPVRRHLQSFMAEHCLVSADLPFQSNIQFTYMRDDGCAFSWPDHYLCNHSQFHRVDFGTNLSDHCPLRCSLRFPALPQVPDCVPSRPSSDVGRIDWKSVTSDHIWSFCELISTRLPIFPKCVMGCVKCINHSWMISL